jgi:hypothetical protein
VLAYQRRYKDFTWLVDYLLGQERETGPERVEWTTTRNLPTSDPELAARVMRDTAGQNSWTKKPVYHIMLSAVPGDPIDRAMMERMADRVLDRLGLTEYQAVLVAHLDRPHHHLHIMVNRVHPETGRAWSTWQDWAPVMEVLREEERALGLQQVPSPAQRVREVSRDLAIYERLEALSRAQQAAEAEANTARARATRLEQTAARAGATRDRRDQDLAQVYRDPRKAHEAYLAAVDREGLPAATERLRERPEAFGAVRAVERSRALGLVRTADEGPARAAARAAATAAQEAFEAARAWRIAAVAEAERVGKVFARELEAVYQDPQPARTAFEQLAAERGVVRAAATLGNEPAALGAVRTALSEAPSQSQAQLAQAVAVGVESAQAQARAKAASVIPGAGPLDPSPELTRSELARAMARDGALRAELRALPSRAELERHLSVALDHLSPRALAVLKYRVTGPQFAIALRLRRTFRDLALGREEERDQ